MFDKDNYSALVESYLDGDLQGETLAAFKKELATNTALQQELEFYELANKGIIQHKMSTVEQTIQEVKQAYKAQERRKKIKKYLLILGGVVLMGVAFWVSHTNQTTKQNTNQNKSKSVSNPPISDSATTSKPLIDNEVEESDFNTIKEGKPERKPEGIVRKQYQDTLKHASPQTDTLSNVQSPTTEEVPSKGSLSSAGDNSSKEENMPPVQRKEAINTKSEFSTCEGVVIRMQAEAKATCKGSEGGQVLISETQGGQAPYRYELFAGELSLGEEMTQLAAGTYTIVVTDKNNCQATVQLEVPEKLCKLNLYLDPGSGVPVVFPEYDKDGLLSIFDKNGSLKFSERIEAHRLFNWYGNSNNGNLAPGYYILIIEFEDGTIQNGSVTITP